MDAQIVIYYEEEYIRWQPNREDSISTSSVENEREEVVQKILALPSPLKFMLMCVFISVLAFNLIIITRAVPETQTSHIRDSSVIISLAPLLLPRRVLFTERRNCKCNILIAVYIFMDGSLLPDLLSKLCY